MAIVKAFERPWLRQGSGGDYHGRGRAAAFARTALGLSLALGALALPAAAAHAGTQVETRRVPFLQRAIKYCRPVLPMDLFAWPITCVATQALTAGPAEPFLVFSFDEPEFERLYRTEIIKNGGPLLKGCVAKEAAIECRFGNRPNFLPYEVTAFVETAKDGKISRIKVVGDRSDKNAGPIMYYAVVGTLAAALNPETTQAESDALAEALGLLNGGLTAEKRYVQSQLSIRCQEPASGLATCIFEPVP